MTKNSELTDICGVVSSAFDNCSCHIFDASGSEWRNEDYPHELFFCGELDTRALKMYSSGEMIQQRSGQMNISGCRKAVVIHPIFVKELEKDTSLTLRLLADIQNWFDYSAQCCSARLPCGALLSQCVVVGASGSIVNACEYAGGLRLWDGRAKNIDQPVRRADYYRTVAGEKPNVPNAHNLACALMFAHKPDYIKDSVGTLKFNGAF